MEENQFEIEDAIQEDFIIEDRFDDSGFDEVVDSDPEDVEESGSEESEEEIDADPEEESENSEVEDQLEELDEITRESVSGNDIVTISGNAIIFPEDFDLSMLQGSSEVEVGNLDSVVESLENQTNIILAVSVVSIFLLGVLVGILFIQGFRLRRV